MTTPQYPDPTQPPDPNAYQPPSPGPYQAPDPSAYQPPSGANQQPNVAPQPGQPGAYPPPGQPGAYPSPSGQPGAYPQPGQPRAYPSPSGQPGAYPPPSGEPGGTYPPPGQPGVPPAPGEEPKKSNTPRIILAVAVVVVVVLGIVLYVVNRQSDPSTAAVGDCVKVNSVSTDDADLDKVDCGDPDASYKVTASGSDSVTCDDNESEYTEEDSDGDTTTTLCLQPNVTAGDCFKIGDDTTPDAKVDCSSTKGDEDVFKILAFKHKTSKESACPAGTDIPVSFPTHTGVLCMTENN